MEKLEKKIVGRGQVFEKTAIRFIVPTDQFAMAETKLEPAKDVMMTMDIPTPAGPAAFAIQALNSPL